MRQMRVKPKRKRGLSIFGRRRICRFCRDKVKNIDYKDLKMLEGLLKERGKIVSSRFSGNCARHQRQVSRAIKKARFIALIPYVRM